MIASVKLLNFLITKSLKFGNLTLDSDTKIQLKSNTTAKVINKKVINIDFDIEIGQNGIAVFEVKSKNKTIRAILVEA